MDETVKLKRSLSFLDVLVYGLLYFVPIAPMAVFGFIYNTSKGMVALTYLVTGLAMIFSAISYSEMARKIPLSGSVYSYVSKGVNPIFGFISGWAILLDYLLLPALLAILGAWALEPILPGVNKLIWVFLFVLIPLIVNVCGIQMNVRLGKLLLVIQLVVLAVFCVFAVMKLVTVGVTTEMLMAPLFNKESFTASIIFAAVPVAALSFIGFDAVSTLNEEAIGGGAAVSKATMYLLVIVTFLFVIQVYLAAVFIPVNTVFTPEEEGTVYYIVSTGIVGKWFLPVITLTNAVIALLANALVSQATSSKVLFNMARDKRLPIVMSQLNKYNAPYVSIITVAALSLVIAILGIDEPELVVTLVTFGALVAYILLNITVMIYFKKINEVNIFKHIISPICGTAILLFALIKAKDNAQIVGIAWIALGIVIMLLLKWRNRLDDISLDV